MDELGFVWNVPKNMKFWRRELALVDNTTVPDKEMYRVSYELCVVFLHVNIYLCPPFVKIVYNLFDCFSDSSDKSNDGSATGTRVRGREEKINSISCRIRYKRSDAPAVDVSRGERKRING